MAGSSREIRVAVGKGNETSALLYPSQSSTTGSAALILAHGAGAGQRHPFMTSFARELSQHGLDVATFDFLYIARGRKVPDRMPELVACYRAVIDAVHQNLGGVRERLFIGGKSMGGRAATHVAAADAGLPIAGIVLLGYPLHPPGRPDQTRDAHLPEVRRPMLFVQGSRDAFGTPSELKPVLATLSPEPTLHTVEGGDHSFKISGRDSSKQQSIYSDVQRTILNWIGTV